MAIYTLPAYIQHICCDSRAGLNVNNPRALRTRDLPWTFRSFSRTTWRNLLSTQVPVAALFCNKAARNHINTSIHSSHRHTTHVVTQVSKRLYAPGGGISIASEATPVRMCIDPCPGMFVDTCADMFIDMCMDKWALLCVALLCGAHCVGLNLSGRIPEA